MAEIIFDVSLEGGKYRFVRSNMDEFPIAYRNGEKWEAGTRDMEELQFRNWLYWLFIEHQEAVVQLAAARAALQDAQNSPVERISAALIALGGPQAAPGKAPASGQE